MLLQKRSADKLLYPFPAMPFTSKAVLQPVAVVLCGLISLPSPAQDRPSRIDIVVIQGEGAVNSIRRRAAIDPVVRIEDGDHKPVAGAVVVFTLPTEGVTGEFNGEKTLIVTSDAGGLAAAKPLKLNALPGKMPIHVTASYRGLAAKGLINQVSAVPPGEKAGKAGGKGHGALIAVLLSLGAAAGGGAAYLVSQQGKEQQPAPTAPATAIGITAGTGTIAGGR